MYTRKYIHQTHLNASPERVYRWHDEPSALQRLTPVEDAIDVVKAAKLGDGNQAHLRIPLLGCCLYVDWTAELENVQQGCEFSDRQIKGPFKMWRLLAFFIMAVDLAAICPDNHRTTLDDVVRPICRT